MNDAAVSVYGVDLVSEYADGREICVPNTTTTLDFATSGGTVSLVSDFAFLNMTDRIIAAKEFHSALADMRFELFIHSLRYPRPEEEVVASM